MGQPALEHAGERGLARARSRHREHEAVADVVRDLVGQVEDEGEAIVGAVEAMRVGVAEDRQAGEVVVGSAAIGESQDVERGLRTSAVDRFEVGAEDPAVVQGDALLAEQQLPGAALERVAIAGQQMLDDRRDDAFDEHRRDRDRAAAKEGQVIRLERAGGAQCIAYREVGLVVGASVGVDQGGERSGRLLPAWAARPASGAGDARRRTTRRPAPARASRATSAGTHRRAPATTADRTGVRESGLASRSIIRCAGAASINAFPRH